MTERDPSDETLAVMAQNGDEDALERLLERYKPLVRKLAQRYFIRGADRDDVIQEAMIGLFKAVHSFNRDQGYPFAALAKKSCEMSIIDAVRRADTQKNSFLNDSLSLDEYQLTNDQLMDEQGSEAEQGLNEESVVEEWRKLLSKREFQILQKRLQGRSYKEIAEELQITTKSVDNALQRIRRKIQKF